MGYAYDEGVGRNSGSVLSVEEPEAEGRVGEEVAPAVEAPEGQVRQSSSDDAGDTPHHVGVAVGHDLGLLLPLQRARLPMSEGIRGMQGTRLHRGEREESDHPQQAAHRRRQALRSRKGLQGCLRLFRVVGRCRGTLHTLTSALSLSQDHNPQQQQRMRCVMAVS